MSPGSIALEPWLVQLVLLGANTHWAIGSAAVGILGPQSWDSIVDEDLVCSGSQCVSSVTEMG